MILLNRLFSETDLFDEIIFKNGINIVLGKYSIGNRGPGINGIGKSTLIRLIDFALLGNETKREYFSTKKYSFLSGHNLTLEFSIENEKYYIKRTFSNHRKVYFGKKGRLLTEFSIEELRNVMQNRFFPIEEVGFKLGEQWFRSLIKFFVKDDINHHERNDPLNFIHSKMKNVDLLIYNFFLLGLQNQSIYDFSIKDRELKDLKTTNKQLEKKIKEDTGKTTGEFKNEIVKIEDKIKKLEEGLSRYKFLENYKDIEDRLIELSNLINDELKKYHCLDRKLKQFQESYKIEIEADIRKVGEIYEEINKSLGGFILKKLEDVINFRTEIAENRKRFLIDREKKIEESIKQILKKISVLEEERSNLFNILNEEKALDCIKNNYQQLIEEKAKIQKNSFKLDQIKEIEVKISELNTSLSKLKTDVINVIHLLDDEIKGLISLYTEIIDNAIFVDKKKDGGLFNISTTAKKPAIITVEIPKSESLGKSRLKILAYDLLVFFNIIKSRRKLPYFLIHDGVFHGIEKKTLVNVLNYINSQVLIHGKFQYILTANEDEIYISDDKKRIFGEYNFDLNQKVIKKFEDIPERMIFKKEFS